MAIEQAALGNTIPLRFTAEEFDIMIAELSCEPAKIDMALTLIVKILENVDSAFDTWTRFYFIREHALAEDLKQYVCFELLKRVAVKIYNEDGTLIDPNHFQAWVLATGKFRAYDFTRREIRYRYQLPDDVQVNVDFDETETDDAGKKRRSYAYIPMKALDESASDEDRDAYHGMYASASQLGDAVIEDAFASVEWEDDLNERLKRCLDAILRSKIATHKTVTWIAYQVLVNLHGNTRKDTTRWMAAKLGDKTLEEIFAMAYRYADRFVWLRLEDYQLSVVHEMFDAVTEDGRRVGELKYCECFMRKGGRASISDWLNRFNAVMEREGVQ